MRCLVAWRRGFKSSLWPDPTLASLEAQEERRVRREAGLAHAPRRVGKRAGRVGAAQVKGEALADVRLHVGAQRADALVVAKLDNQRRAAAAACAGADAAATQVAARRRRPNSVCENRSRIYLIKPCATVH